MSNQPEINLNEPRYDQSTYSGRAKHFFVTTNPLNILASNKSLDGAKDIVENYRQTKVLPANLSVDELWKAKYLFDSAFHPDTKEKMFFAGRMSAQVPCNLMITAGMLTWYKTTPAVVLWQVLNQSFNAIVNYTNRSGDKPITTTRLGISFGIATSSATATAIFLNSLTRKMPPIAGRFVPFAAVAAANCINLPFMRSTEIAEGIQLVNEKGENVAQSPKVGKSAIAQVVLSRVFMATPGMVLTPLVMDYIERKFPNIKASFPKTMGIQLLILGGCLIFATPMCCAIFPQKKAIQVGELEPEVRDKLFKDGYNLTDNVYYNKGL
jgi:tricarboxylate carrier